MISPADAQATIAVHRDGEMVHSVSVEPAQTASQLASPLGAPTISADVQARNRAFGRAAIAAQRMQDLLDKMATSDTRAGETDRKRLRSLLRKFLWLDDRARATMNKTVDIPAESRVATAQRHSDTVAALERGRSELIEALTAVLSGEPRALSHARSVMRRLKFRDQPGPEETTPRQTLRPFVSAPRLTREQADALLTESPLANRPITQSSSEMLPARRSVFPAGELSSTVDVQITAEITETATALGNSPLAIYEYVRNNVAFQPYLGSRKGSVFTLQQRAGNDTDQASLLLALLRAANVPSRYVRGTIEMTPEQAMDWLGVDDADTAGAILATAGLDGITVVNGPEVVAIRCTHVWIEAYVPYSNYRGIANDASGEAWIPLDPSYKSHAVHQGENVLEAMGFDTNAFLADYISTLHAESPIEKLQRDVQTWLNSNRPGQTVADVERTSAITPLALGILPASSPYQVLAISDQINELESAQRYRIRFHLYSGGTHFIDHTISLPELITKRLTIDYIGATANDQATIDSYGGVYQTPPNLVSVRARLKLDGAAVVTSANASGMGYSHTWDMEFFQPAGDNNVQPVVSNTITAGNGQAIAFDTFLDVPRGFVGGDSASPGSLLDATLHDTAAAYLSRVARGQEAASRLMRMATILDVSEAIVENAVKVTYSFGTPVTFEWTGMIVDADRRIVGPFAVDGNPAKSVPYMKITGYDASNMENRVFEDLYGQEAVSTIKILELANDAGIGVCTITNNIAAQCPGFSQPAAVTNAVNSALAQGHHVIIPKTGMTISLWSGTGYIDLTPSTGAAGYIISGGISNHVSIAGGATVDLWPVNLGCSAIPPITGMITPVGFSNGDEMCADGSKISYSVSLQYDCQDPEGNIVHKSFGPTTHTVPSSKRQIAQSSGAGTYTISIPGTEVPPVTFKLIYLECADPGAINPNIKVLNDITSGIAGGGLTTMNLSDVTLNGCLYLDESCKWRVRAKEAAQTIHWGIRTGFYTEPRLPPAAGATINCGNALTAASDMAGYQLRQGVGLWHLAAASTTHEKNHVDWFANFAVSRWPSFESAIEAKILGMAPTMTEAQAQTAMGTYVQQQRVDWYDPTASAPEPPAYAAGQAVLNPVIAQIMAWEAANCP